MDFRTSTVAELAEGVRSGRLRSRDLVEHALDRIGALNPRLGAFVAVDPGAARAAADDVDRRVAAGDDPGPLAGIPIGVKDLEDARGFTTTYGSAAFAADPPAEHDSTLVARLRAAGCVVLGKTNTPELGWTAATDNVVFGPTANPWDASRSPGGSSGGTAAALASGMVPLATGSDGGGSIRIPGALCGFSAFKPSLGRIPMGGPTPPGKPLISTSGPMALRVRDTALALDSVVGPDPTDLRSLPMPPTRWRRALDEIHPPHRVGWSATLGYAEVDAEVRRVCDAALSELEARGVEVVDVDPVFDEDPVLVWMSLWSAYNMRTLSHVRGGEGWDRIDPGLRAQIDWGVANLSVVDLLRAEDACHRVNHRLAEVLAGVDVLLTPTVAGRTPVAGEHGTVDGQVTATWVRFTYPFNLTRSPAGSVRVGFDGDGMPVGLQVVGPQHGDVAVLRAMAVLEDACTDERLAPVR